MNVKVRNTAIAIAVITILVLLGGLMRATIRLRTTEFLFQAPTAEAFARWSFASEFVIPPPASAGDIRAVACPGSDLYNADYSMGEEAFRVFSKSCGALNTPIRGSALVDQFLRQGESGRIASGYHLQPTNLPRSVSVNIWYDDATSNVLYRQWGRIQRPSNQDSALAK